MKPGERMDCLKFRVFVFLNILLFGFFLVLIFPDSVNAVVGEDNVTVETNLTVGSVYPEILNVSIEDDASSFSLIPNSTKTLSCVVRVRDYNGDDDVENVNATLYDVTASFVDDADDNNYHYTNSSCEINTTGEWGGYVDDEYHLIANCSFEVEYYANPGTWNCSATAVDNTSWTDTKEDSIAFNDLLALGLPDIIQYGTVNSTEVSNENVTNVTNYGNTLINLSLEGYAQTEGDGYAMNCSRGNVGNIPIYYEKYNLSDSNPGDLDLTSFEGVYANLTSESVVRDFRLNYRQNDSVNKAVNQSYWRIYVPRGVAGTCQGNIIFGATQSAGTPY